MSSFLRIAGLLVALAACSAAPGSGPDASTSDPDAGPVDLATAQWRHTNVFSGPGTTVSSLDMAISPASELVITWSEAVESNPIRTVVMVATGTDPFTSVNVFDNPSESFNASTVFAGNGVHAVATSLDPVTNSDIFYASQTGATWTSPINLTAPTDASAFTDFDPQVLEAGSEIVVVFRSRITGGLQNDGLYLLRFTDPGSAGTAQPILDRATFDCGNFRAAADSQGAIHILAQCREDAGLSELFYLNNTSGTFSRQDVGLAGATSPLSPDITLAADGSVHLLWNASTDCDGTTCRDVFYSRDLSPAVSVTGGEEDGGFFPHVAIDPLGRVIVVFHRLGNVDDVLWTYSESGSSFVRTQLATPGTEDSTDSTVGNLVIHPQTGLPHMVFSRSVQGAGSDVYHGQLVP